MVDRMTATLGQSPKRCATSLAAAASIGASAGHLRGRSSIPVAGRSQALPRCAERARGLRRLLENLLRSHDWAEDNVMTAEAWRIRTSVVESSAPRLPLERAGVRAAAGAAGGPLGVEDHRAREGGRQPRALDAAGASPRRSSPSAGRRPARPRNCDPSIGGQLRFAEQRGYR